MSLEDCLSCVLWVAVGFALDTVNHNILLKKLNYYAPLGITTRRFQLYLNDRMQLMCQSSKKHLGYDFPKELVLGLIFLYYLLLILMKLLNLAQFIILLMTPVIFFEQSLKMISKHINRDLKLVVKWIRVNKFSLNISKTELVLIKSKNNIIAKDLNFHVSGQKIKHSFYIRLELAFIKTRKETKSQKQSATLKSCSFSKKRTQDNRFQNTSITFWLHIQRKSRKTWRYSTICLPH